MLRLFLVLIGLVSPLHSAFGNAPTRSIFPMNRASTVDETSVLQAKATRLDEEKVARTSRAAFSPPKRPIATVVGAICGDPKLVGSVIDPILSETKGCGIAEPVRVTQVAGIKLSQASVMDCVTAKTLRKWADRSVPEAIGNLGGGAASLRIMGHYSCRTRNSVKGAKISEHGLGHAIDIGGITLKNGVEISVLKGWDDPIQGRILKDLHKAACGPFGTVLGPDANKFHKDHFHFDTARYRAGAYCR